VAVPLGDPPNASPEVLVPAPPKSCLAMFKLFTSDHEVPFQFSVNDVTPGKPPPKHKAAVCIPDAPGLFVLPVFKELTEVQLVPFYDSVAVCTAPGGVSPAKAKAAKFVSPTPAKLALAVFKSLTSVQLVPL